jgi:hypothetical protein
MLAFSDIMGIIEYYELGCKSLITKASACNSLMLFAAGSSFFNVCAVLACISDVEPKRNIRSLSPLWFFLRHAIPSTLSPYIWHVTYSESRKVLRSLCHLIAVGVGC